MIIFKKGENEKGLFSFLRNSKKYPILKNIEVKNSSLRMTPNNYSHLKPFGIADKFSWLSNQIENSWLRVSFPNFCVKADSYAIKSYEYLYPSSWTLQGRNEKGEEDWDNVSFVE